MRWRARTCRSRLRSATGAGNSAPFRYLAWWFWRVHGPLMLALKGYIPTGGGWAGLPLPRGVYEEWRRWCLRPDHFGPDLRTYLSDNVFAEIRAPLLTVGFTDDPIATRRTVAELDEFYPERARANRAGIRRRTRAARASATKASSPRATATRCGARCSTGWTRRLGRCHEHHGVPAEHITPYDRFALDEATLVALLAARTRNEGLVEYFGAALHAELAKLARATHAPRGRAGPPRVRAARHHGLAAGLHARRPRSPTTFSGWIPSTFAFGRLTELRLAHDSRVVALGAMSYTYLKLTLSLRKAGFDAVLLDYDWRRDIATLGKLLAERIAADGTRRTWRCVGHSMGGLVARAALTHAAGNRVSQLIMLGTPNCGLARRHAGAARHVFGGAQNRACSICGTTRNSSRSAVFSTFPGLHELLPAGDASAISTCSIPTRGRRRDPGPDAAMLRERAGLEQRLAPADARFHLVIGCNRTTATGVALRDGDFEYEYSLQRRRHRAHRARAARRCAPPLRGLRSQRPAAVGSRDRRHHRPAEDRRDAPLRRVAAACGAARARGCSDTRAAPGIPGQGRLAAHEPRGAPAVPRHAQRAAAPPAAWLNSGPRILAATSREAREPPPGKAGVISTPAASAVTLSCSTPGAFARVEPAPPVTPARRESLHAGARRLVLEIRQCEVARRCAHQERPAVETIGQRIRHAARLQIL